MVALRPALIAVALYGCEPFTPPDPTFWQDIAPLVATQCQPCHRPDGIVPHPALDDYETAKSYAEVIRMDLESRIMPPWGADNSGSCGTWQDAHWLSDEQISRVALWADNGAPEGTPDAVSMASSLPVPFRRDAVLDTGGIYRPGLGAGGNRCFVADPFLDRDRLLTAIRVSSSDMRAVAQVTLFALDSSAAESEVEALDAADPEPGYPCFGTARTREARLVAAWTWPDPVLRMPAGVGVRLGAHRKLVIQIHYDVARTGSAYSSQTEVDLELQDGVTEARALAVSVPGELQPGLAEVSVDGSQSADRKMRIVAVAPRMHIRGKSMRLIAERAGGSICVGDFPRWDFYDAQLFKARNPITVEAGDRLHLFCSFRTLGRAAPVAFGDEIDDEECVAYLLVTD